jgi:hypothetical protein
MRILMHGWCTQHRKQYDRCCSFRFRRRCTNWKVACRFAERQKTPLTGGQMGARCLPGVRGGHCHRSGRKEAQPAAAAPGPAPAAGCCWRCAPQPARVLGRIRVEGDCTHFRAMRAAMPSHYSYSLATCDPHGCCCSANVDCCAHKDAHQGRQGLGGGLRLVHVVPSELRCGGGVAGRCGACRRRHAR